MFGEIKITQLHCFVQGSSWENLKSFAFGFMSGELQLVEEDEGSFMIIGQNRHFRAEAFVLSASGVPWDFEVSLTLERPPLPFDEWIEVQFARELALSLHAQTFCEPPLDLLKSYTPELKLAFKPTSTGMETLWMELFEKDIAQVEIVRSTQVDLRNITLFQQNFPYR